MHSTQFSYHYIKSIMKSHNLIGPLHDPVTWYKITYTGEQIAQWDFQNKGRCIVLEVPLRNLLTSIFNFVPCDRVAQRAYYITLAYSVNSRTTIFLVSTNIY